MKRYDLIVIGSGPGGYVAAQRAGTLGKRVLLIEKGELGGVCTNVGCIPTKSLLAAAKRYQSATASQQFGVTVEGATFDYPVAAAHKDETVATLRNGIAFLMKSAKVDVVTGEAKVLDAHTVQVADTTYQGDYLILATGSRPLVPPIPGADLAHVMTSDEVLSLSEAPASMVIIGGGVIGVEFASFFSMIGVEVTVIEMMDEILPMADAEFSKRLRREMKGVTFHLSSKVEEITKDSVIYTDKKGERQELATASVLLSVGRRPNIEGLEHLGLAIENSGIVVNERMQTNLPTVYAVGDCNGKSLLAHSASRMAEVAISNIFGTKAMRMRYNAIPTVVYSNPELAGCGLTEKEAKAAGYETLSQTAQMRASGRFLAEEGKRAGGLVSVVADATSGAILGIHLLGSYSSEIIWGAAALIEAELRIQDVKELIFPHPSVNELIKEVCFQLDASL
ncbi:MAG TPA: dihydrolipoyl dehydrogenase [Sphaerochaeta sp.]|nr:dihydrolipoyl dehydrogenase [Sphaerochaeta sp.]